MGETKLVFLLQMLGDHGREMLLYYIYIYIHIWPKNYILVMRKEGKKEERWSNMKNNLKIDHFGHTLKNKLIHFLVRGHFSWSTFGLHLVKGPKPLRMPFLFIEIGPWNIPN